MSFRNQPPDEAFIDLGKGWPGFDLLPQEILKQAANHRLGENDRSLLNYGDNPGDYFHYSRWGSHPPHR